MRRAVLVAGSPEIAWERLAKARAAADVLMGIDSGAFRLWEREIIPDVVTGDFDSLPLVVRRELALRGAEVIETPDQNFTDLDKALALCVERCLDEVLVFGATGGRLDHTFAGFSALVKYGRSLVVRVVDAIGEMVLVRPDGLTLVGAELVGRGLSLLPLGVVTGITTTGVRWTLEEAMLAPGVRDGTSNIITEKVVTVRHRSGDLLLFVHHAPEEEGHHR